MPLFYLNLYFVEEGCQAIFHNRSPLLIAIDVDPILMYETKCRPPKDFRTPVYYSLPRYYVMQVLSEMAAYKCSNGYYTLYGLRIPR
ncbi:hypothetical protein KUTeg_018821 [Tegillarca granosa]|uniref:Uncharacterized protein n=1 Tax=Tegillarca granosa TaxID=220873 RepID=A0ABQ9EFY4_TEGGR|nr:hypothetical protein KUTeg_018821 [Tegillarca granosa]